MSHPRKISALICLGIACLGAVGCGMVPHLRLDRQYRKADRAFEQGDYALAATYYEGLSERYPTSPRRERMMINQGISLYTLGAWHESRAVFHRYQREFPNGEMAGTAADHIRRIETLLSSPDRTDEQTLIAARQDMNELYRLARDHPRDPDIYRAIGNLHWEMGNYEEAARYYYQSQEVSAAGTENELIKTRTVVMPDGTLAPLSADRRAEIERDKNPLVVFDTADYTARDQDQVYGGQQRYYVVTGKIHNQSRRLLHDVAIEVTFFNAQHNVLDVDVVRLGSLGPGAVRAWRATASSYDNLYNIVDFSTATMIGGIDVQ